MYLVTASEIQAMDRQTIESFGLPGIVLMENAGQGATRVCLKHFSEQLTNGVAVIAGRGNNGGDGFVIARCLAQKGFRVAVYLLANAKQVKGDAAANLKLLSPLHIPIIEMPHETDFVSHKSDLAQFGLLVDSILGTGLKSDVKGYFQTVINFINSQDKPVFAVDIPSGLNSDTGQPCGVCIRANSTATFAFAKIGHHVFPGTDHTGRLEVIDIGIPGYIAEAVGPKHFLLTKNLVRNYLNPRPADAHKGHSGHLLVIAGSPGKTGAAAMTAISAMRTGAGLVTLGVPKSLNPVIEGQVLEIMTYPLPETAAGVLDSADMKAITELSSGKKCIALGPGIGQAPETRELVGRIITDSRIPLVIDADGLNNLTGQEQILKNCKAPVILTPHPAEMARLIDDTVAFVQQNRVSCARALAQKLNVHLILKGAKTVVAHPDGRVFINSTGNAGMASGGMGDVLTGIIAGLVAQGLTPEKAAHAAVYLHGAAADALSASMGPIGYLAGDVMEAIPGVLGRLIEER
jgi:NAD(P)H-hydrate epimerase